MLSVLCGYIIIGVKGCSAYLVIHDGPQTHYTDMHIVPGFPHVELVDMSIRGSGGIDGVRSLEVAPRTSRHTRG